MIPSPFDLAVVVPAAGAGRRMGGSRKTYLQLDSTPVLLRSLQPFLRRPDVRSIVIALAREDVEEPPAWLERADPRIRIVEGGHSRFDSVRRAFAAVDPRIDLVAIHDGARPLLDDATVERCVVLASTGVGAVAGVPTVDTMKRVDARGRILETPDRSTLWHAQTPQVFPREVFAEALSAWPSGADAPTDDSALVEALGAPVEMVLGSHTNIKITHPGDLELALTLLRSRGSAGAPVTDREEGP